LDADMAPSPEHTRSNIGEGVMVAGKGLQDFLASKYLTDYITYSTFAVVFSSLSSSSEKDHSFYFFLIMFYMFIYK
jgi:hypothetical protein